MSKSLTGKEKIAHRRQESLSSGNHKQGKSPTLVENGTFSMLAPQKTRRYTSSGANTAALLTRGQTGTRVRRGAPPCLFPHERLVATAHSPSVEHGACSCVTSRRSLHFPKVSFRHQVPGDFRSHRDRVQTSQSVHQRCRTALSSQKLLLSGSCARKNTSTKRK